jgi:hypothetical protein
MQSFEVSQLSKELSTFSGDVTAEDQPPGCVLPQVSSLPSRTFQGNRIDIPRLPSSVSLEFGAILEPLGVAIHGSRRAALSAGSTVLVLGAGAVGLLCAAMAKVSGAKTVIIADIQAERVEFAVANKFADAKIVVPMKRPQTIEDKLAFAKEVAETVKGVAGEVDAVFECTGVESCVQVAIYVSFLSVATRFLLIRKVDTTRWKNHVNWNGKPYPDPPSLSRCVTRGGSLGRFQICEHI